MSEKEKVIIPGTYVRLSYTAMTKDGTVTESTKRRVREGEEEKEVDIPIIIKVGSKEVFFEEELIGLKAGDEKEFIIPPERAYGHRDPSKVERIPIKKLRAMLGGKKPYVGALLYDENERYYGKIIYVGSRDAMVDRNHPFADKEIIVKVKIHDTVPPDASEDDKIRIILKRHIPDLAEKFRFKKEDGVLEIIVPSEITLKLSAVDLIRNVWLNRKALADELLREINIEGVKFIDEFKLEKIAEPSEAKEAKEESRE